MKTTLNKVMTELLPALQNISFMQGQGLIMIPAKVSYAIGKNLTAIQPLITEYNKQRKLMLEKTVNKDDAGKLKTILNPEKVEVYDFKRGGNEIFNSLLEVYKEEEVEFQTYRIQKDILEQMDNFPVAAYGILDEFEMISELNIAMVKLAN